MKFLSFIILLFVSFNALSVEYKYDDSNKLQQVNYDNGTVVSYAYDSDGNITKVSPTESSSGGDTGGGTDNGGTDGGNTDNGKPDAPEPEKKKSGGSFDFGLFALLLSLPFFRRFNRK